MRRVSAGRAYATDFEGLFGEPEENLDEAAKALLDPGQVTLQALSHELPPMCVRQRLLAYLAGTPVNSRPKPRIPDNPFEKKPKKLTGTSLTPMGYTLPRLHATFTNTTSSTMRITRVFPEQDTGPVVARIRRPKANEREDLSG